MTITSFDNGIPNTFYQEKTMQGRLMIFLRHVACRLFKRDMIRKDLDKISIMVREGDKETCEMYFDGNLIGHIKMIQATKDFIFKQ